MRLYGIFNAKNVSMALCEEHKLGVVFSSTNKIPSASQDIENNAIHSLEKHDDVFPYFYYHSCDLQAEVFLRYGFYMYL